MNKDAILATKQRIFSQYMAMTGLTIRPCKGTDREFEAVATIENANYPDPLHKLSGWQFQVEPGALKQVEGKKEITAYP
jgi:hypothetical protein